MEYVVTVRGLVSYQSEDGAVSHVFISNFSDELTFRTQEDGNATDHRLLATSYVGSSEHPTWMQYNLLSTSAISQYVKKSPKK